MKTKIRAEELLAAENFSKEFLSQNAEEGQLDNGEIRIAQTISSFLLTSSEDFEREEKEVTKNHIRHSIRKRTFRKRLIQWSAAASLLFAILFTSIGYFKVHSTSEIAQFAETIKDIKPANNTRIILQNGEEVQIHKKVSQIRYDATGENIKVDSAQKVVQKVVNSRTTFNTVIVPYGKRTQITLSDGTKIWLNSGSKLVYPAVFADGKREVFIDGEAVFDVVHLNDTPFIVRARDFDIRVLGTIFNVNAYSDDKNSSAVLETGRIELTLNRNSVLTKPRLNISPGTMAICNPEENNFEQKQVNPALYLSWREGYLTLNSERLEDIARKLSRYYNIQLIISDIDLKNMTFSGCMDLKTSPGEVLSVINETTSITYSKDQDKIYINPK
ncbi:MAG: FecR domain-containing protein [Prolixibacteraceae bacterium]